MFLLTFWTIKSDAAYILWVSLGETLMRDAHVCETNMVCAKFLRWHAAIISGSQVLIRPVYSYSYRCG